MEQTVTTARAAEIIAIGYEGLRTYLKRGLLGSSGVMPPFVHSTAPAPDLSRVRATWKRFDFTDLCLMRLAKQLIDLGLSFDQANAIASCNEVRKAFAYQTRAGDKLITWPPYYDFMVFAGNDMQHLPQRLAEVGDIALLVQLDRISKHVRSQIAENA